MIRSSATTASTIPINKCVLLFVLDVSVTIVVWSEELWPTEYKVSLTYSVAFSSMYPWVVEFTAGIIPLAMDVGEMVLTVKIHSTGLTAINMHYLNAYVLGYLT